MARHGLSALATPRTQNEARPHPVQRALRADEVRREPKEPSPVVAAVDDDPAVLRSLVRLLSVRGFDAKAFSSPETLLAEIATVSPECLIVDLSMPVFGGLELQRRLKETGHDYPIVFLTGHGDIRASVLAMRSGAVDFLTKPIAQVELLDAIDRALARGKHAREAAERAAALRRRVSSLTLREGQVFEQVVAGFLNKEIAANLGISEKTVKVHRANVMRKMRVRSVAELARIAERLETERPVA